MWRISLFLLSLILFFPLIAQESPEEAIEEDQITEQDLKNEPLSDDQFKTNNGEEFKDPFSEPPAPAPAEPAAPSMGQMPADQTIPEPSTLPAPSEGSLPENSTNPSPAAAPSEAAPEETLSNPENLENSSPAENDARKKPFLFPEEEQRIEGPVAQDVVEREANTRSSGEGAWSLGLGVGPMINLNRSANQVSFEINGGYRLNDEWEVDTTLGYRFANGTDVLLMPALQWFWRISEPGDWRIEFAPRGGLGLSFAYYSDKFRMTSFLLRLDSEFLFYVTPTFALTATPGLETAFLAVDGDGIWTNLMKSSGPPTQMLLILGTRFEF